MADLPQLLRVPQSFRSVTEVLACAERMELTNVVVLSERENDAVVLIGSGMSMAQTNWLLDQIYQPAHSLPPSVAVMPDDTNFTVTTI